MSQVINLKYEKEIYLLIRELKAFDTNIQYSYCSKSKTISIYKKNLIINIFINLESFENRNEIFSAYVSLINAYKEDSIYELIVKEYKDYIFPSIILKSIFPNSRYIELTDIFSSSVKNILAIQPILNIHGIVVGLDAEKLKESLGEKNNLIELLYTNNEKLSVVNCKKENGMIVFDVSMTSNSIITTQSFTELINKDSFMISIPNRREVIVNEKKSLVNFFNNSKDKFFNSETPLLSTDNILYYENNKYRFLNEIF